MRVESDEKKFWLVIVDFRLYQLNFQSIRQDKKKSNERNRQLCELL